MQRNNSRPAPHLVVDEGHLDAVKNCDLAVRVHRNHRCCCAACAHRGGEVAGQCLQTVHSVAGLSGVVGVWRGVRGKGVGGEVKSLTVMRIWGGSVEGERRVRCGRFFTTHP